MTAESTEKHGHDAAPREESRRLADLAAVLWRQRLLVGGTIFIVLAASLTAVFLMIPRYTARVTFMPPPSEGDSFSSFLRDPLNAVLRRGAGASLDRLTSFANSETTRRIIVERFTLKEHYRATYLVQALTGLENATVVVVSPEGAITISVTDRDPQLASEIANAYTDIVDSLYQQAETTHAGQMRQFLEVRVAQNRAALATVEARAQDFAQRHGVVSLPDQVSAVIDQMATVEAQIRALDVKIGATREILGPDYVSLREMTIERSQLLVQRQSLLSARSGGSSDPLLSFHEIPALAVEYAKLQREVKIQSLIQELLIQQYEIAKLDEMRTVSAITRLDRAYLPELRSWPRRGRILVLSGVMGVIWGILLAYLAEAWPGMKSRFARHAAPAQRQGPPSDG